MTSSKLPWFHQNFHVQTKASMTTQKLLWPHQSSHDFIKASKARLKHLRPHQSFHDLIKASMVRPKVSWAQQSSYDKSQGFHCFQSREVTLPMPLWIPWSLYSANWSCECFLWVSNGDLHLYGDTTPSRPQLFSKLSKNNKHAFLLNKNILNYTSKFLTWITANQFHHPLLWDGPNATYDKKDLVNI